MATTPIEASLPVGVLIVAGIFAYFLIARFTVFLGLKLFGGPPELANELPVQIVGCVWPLTLPILLIWALVAAVKTVYYWPNSPTDLRKGQQ